MFRPEAPSDEQIRCDAMTTCWSNYRHDFETDGHGFGNDLAAYYKLYIGLMEFWNSDSRDASITSGTKR